MEFIKKYAILIFLLVPLVSLADGWQKSASGIEYKFHIQNPGDKPELGDFVIVDMLYGNGDSVFFDSRKVTNKFEFLLEAPLYQGDLNEGFAMMAMGDSASFRISADSFYLIMVGAPSIPPSIQAGSMLTFEVKMKGFESVEEREKAEAEFLENKRKSEKSILKQYLAENDIQIMPNTSGMYYIQKERGPGKMAKPGDSVYVHYTGKLLDGSIFDSSLDRGEPFKFTLGKGQVIKGWDEGIALMREGGKASFIIPSWLAYGARDIGVIPPYSTLIFEVELVEIR